MAEKDDVRKVAREKGWMYERERSLRISESLTEAIREETESAPEMAAAAEELLENLDIVAREEMEMINQLQEENNGQYQR